MDIVAWIFSSEDIKEKVISETVRRFGDEPTMEEIKAVGLEMATSLRDRELRIKTRIYRKRVRELQTRISVMDYDIERKEKELSNRNKERLGRDLEDLAHVLSGRSRRVGLNTAFLSRKRISDKTEVDLRSLNYRKMVLSAELSMAKADLESAEADVLDQWSWFCT
jgi:hypothetical protein